MRLAVTLALCLMLGACASPIGGAGTPNGNAQSTDTPGSAASAPRIEPAPVTPPTPPGTNLPAFACADARGGVTGSANVTGVRTGEPVGWDRFVIQFDSRVPAYAVTRQAKPTFTTGASGQTLTLSGTSGALVRVHSATGATTYSGSTDLQHAEYAVLKEARLTEDFEGYVSWGLGLSRPACLRTFTLADPPRLVVDFTTSS